MKKTVIILFYCILIAQASVSQMQPMMIKQETTLTNEQKIKLQTPLIKEVDGVYYVEVYSNLTFSKSVLFDERNLKAIVIKQVATMKKDTINKELFLSIASTLNDQLIQSIFMNPVYMHYLMQNENFINKPMKMPDLTVELDFKADGISTKMYATRIKMENFLPYATMFNTKLK